MPRQMGPEAALQIFQGLSRAQKYQEDPFVPINGKKLIEKLVNIKGLCGRTQRMT